MEFAMEQKPRKQKYAPNPNARHVPEKEVKIKPEPVQEDNSNAMATELLRRLSEASLRKLKGERRVHASEIAFMGGGVNSTGRNQYSNASTSHSNPKQEIEYEEPWPRNGYNPITLPQRRPEAGDPELLDVEEFMQDAKNHEELLNTAVDLGLTEDEGGKKMFLFRLPSVPLTKQSTTRENRETKPNMRGGVEKTCDLNALPEGFMGKLLIYNSGAVKMKLGEVLYDMNPGLKSEYAQDVMVVKKNEIECGLLGNVDKHAVLTPDIDSILKEIDNM